MHHRSESPAIYVCKYLLEESARISIYDPKVPKAQIVNDLTDYDPSSRVAASVDKLVSFASDPYEAVAGADALIVCTEWDEFKTLDYEKVYEKMNKPAFVFDGRLILDGVALKKIGFHVQTIGKTIM